VTAFTEQVNDRPVILAPLNIAEHQRDNRGASQSAAKEQRDDRGVALAPKRQSADS
jgi:hypothetical protein